MNTSSIEKENLKRLIKTGEKKNIDLAFGISESLEIDISDIIEPYINLYNWLLKYNAIEECKGNKEIIILLSALKYLSLSNNKLTDIPKEIGQLSALGYLSLSNNELKEIPKEIGQLSSLEYLHLSNNELKESIKNLLPNTNIY